MAQLALYSNGVARKIKLGVATFERTSNAIGGYNINSNMSNGSVNGFNIPSINNVTGASSDRTDYHLTINKEGTHLQSLCTPGSTTRFYLVNGDNDKYIEFTMSANGAISRIYIHNNTCWWDFSTSLLMVDAQLVFIQGTALNQYEDVGFIFNFNNRAWMGWIGSAFCKLDSMLHVGNYTTPSSQWTTPSLIIGDASNPYSPGGYTTPGGGEDINYDDDSDAVSADPLPTRSGIGTGLISIFSPTDSQIQNLGRVLCGKDFFDFLQNTVENLSELFISFGILPFEVPTSRTVNITFFDWVVTLQQQSTNIPVNLVSNQFIDFDMGIINLLDDSRVHRTDSVFDYSPFSRLGIYLPFIGFEELDIDEVRDSAIHLEYRIDILSGSCVALVSTLVDGVERTIYQFSGNCLTQLPLSSADCQTMITNAVNLGISIASAGATGAVASAGAESVEAAVGADKMSRQTADFRNAQFDSQVSNAKGSLVSATANTMMGMKPNYKHSGAIGASSSLLAVKQPYLFLVTPKEAVPEGYEKYCGFPSNITSRLGDLSGYTVVEDIRLNGLVATSNEVAEIYSLLKKGVII